MQVRMLFKRLVRPCKRLTFLEWATVALLLLKHFFAVGDCFLFGAERLEPLDSVLLPGRHPPPIDVLANARDSGRVVRCPLSRSFLPLPLPELAQLLISPPFRPGERRSNASI